MERENKQSKKEQKEIIRRLEEDKQNDKTLIDDLY